jgi:hypothetical protein
MKTIIVRGDDVRGDEELKKKLEEAGAKVEVNEDVKVIVDEEVEEEVKNILKNAKKEREERRKERREKRFLEWLGGRTREFAKGAFICRIDEDHDMTLKWEAKCYVPVFAKNYFYKKFKFDIFNFRFEDLPEFSVEQLEKELEEIERLEGFAFKDISVIDIDVRVNNFSEFYRIFCTPSGKVVDTMGIGVDENRQSPFREVDEIIISLKDLIKEAIGEIQQQYHDENVEEVVL